LCATKLLYADAKNGVDMEKLGAIADRRIAFQNTPKNLFKIFLLSFGIFSLRQKNEESYGPMSRPWERKNMPARPQQRQKPNRPLDPSCPVGLRLYVAV
jgi:hypothetical protein